MPSIMSLDLSPDGLQEHGWPSWVAVVAAAIPGSFAVLAVVQRDALWPPRLPALLAAVAMVPWLVEALPSLRGKSVTVPEPLFGAVVVGAVGALIWNPAQVDTSPFILVFLTGEMASRTAKVGAAVAVACGAVMVGSWAFGRWDDTFGIWLLGIAIGWFAGVTMRAQQLTMVQLRAAHATLAEQAAADERRRIAGEIHDVVAHSLSVTMLHVTAARLALERERSSDALDALREAEHQGRQSLTDIRRTVGLLGSDQEAPPLPGVADIPKLVDDFRSAGLDVRLDVRGELPPAEGLGVYRIVQESLTNVAKHAPDASAEVDLDVSSGRIRLVVRNGPSNGRATLPSGGEGLGLEGMKERARALGGELTAGPDAGGWSVRLVAPRT